MLRLAFDFIITWRETRTRPNAYRFILKSGNKTIEIANIDIKKQYTIFYGEFRYCLILHFDKKTTSFFLPNDCFKWFLAGNNDKITCIHDGKAAFILFSECL